MKTIIVAVIGPTATGKSTLAIRLAERFGGDIVSADAFQIYRDMDIGTAKVSRFQREKTIHHLIDVFEPEATISVHDYQQLARETISNLRDKGTNVFLVGGSGLYLQSILYDYRFTGEKRKPIDSAYQDMNTAELYCLLQEKDPELAKIVHPNNRRRILRSLEIAGSDNVLSRVPGKALYYKDAIVIGLRLERTILYEHIEARVDGMIASGLVDEAKKLYCRNLSLQAASAIGYKELFRHFRGEIDLDQAIAMIKQNSRRYAKRQMTWFNNQMAPEWIDITGLDEKQVFDQAVMLIEKRMSGSRE